MVDIPNGAVAQYLSRRLIYMSLAAGLLPSAYEHGNGQSVQDIDNSIFLKNKEPIV